MSTEKFQATEEERANAARVLSKLLDFDKDPHIPAIALSKILDDVIPHAKTTYAGLVAGTDPEFAKIADTKIPRLLVDLLQLDLLSERSIREIMLKKLFEKDPDNEIFIDRKQRDNQPTQDDLFGSKKLAPSEIARKNWMPGSDTARRFVRAFALPEIFAGVKGQPPSPFSEDIEGPLDLQDLRDFQIDIKDQLLLILKSNSSRHNRGIVRLPTGAGKTRIVVEALIDFWKNRSPPEVKFLLWIAQTEELCEQAFESIRQIWAFKGKHGENLRLFRMWGTKRVLPNLDDEGIIIAGIDKLYAGITNNDNTSEFQSGLQSIAKFIGAIVVDEAHKSTTEMYDEVFKTLGIDFSERDVPNKPLLGLTATPYRGYNASDTRQLNKRYNENRLYPKGEKFDKTIWGNWKSMKEELTRQRILAKPVHYTIETDRMFEFGFEGITVNRPKLDQRVLNTIAADFKRNEVIIKTLLELADKKASILYFAPSVNNANIISAILRDKGIKSAVVTSGTSFGVRQIYIREFKELKIKILCNYGVLTTGFDAPKIDAVVIARPTESPNLYEQMIGRGLRGPEFGGTDECIIMDLLDNILFHTSEKQRFKDGSIDYWNSMDVSEGNDNSDVSS